jgi:nucleoside-diphosphate-sugar epimerase
MRRRVPDIRKIRKALGWQPTTPLETTVDQIIAYYRNKP